MAKVDPNEQDAASRGGGKYVETEDDKKAWRRMRKLINTTPILQDATFMVKGYVKALALDKGNKYFKEDREDKVTKEKKPWYYVLATPVVTDPRIVGEGGKPLELMPKKVGISFFDGRNRDGSRSPFLGGMYKLHRAVTHSEPSQGLMDQKEAWDTDDYCGPDKPVLLEMLFAGIEEEGSKYFGTKANLRVFFQDFHRDPDFAKRISVDDDEDEDDDPPFEAEAPAKPTKTKAAPKQATKVDETDDDDF